MTPSGEAWTVCIPHTATGANLKSKVAGLTNVPARRQRLFCGLSELRTKQPVAQCVEEDAIVTLIVACGNYSVLVAGAKAATIRMMDTCERRRSFRLERGYVIAVAVSPNSLQVATTSTCGGVDLWSVETGEHLASLQGHRRNVFSVDFSPDGSMLLTTAGDCSTRLWNLENKRCMGILWGSTFSASFAPHTHEFVTGGTDGVAQLWDYVTGEIVREYCGHTKQIHCVAFSPSGLLLLTASGDNSLRLWDKETGTCTQAFNSHTHAVLGVAFSTDGDFFMSASADHTAKVWSTESGECTITFVGHKGAVNCAVMSHDGLAVLTASDDGTARIWSVATGDCLTTLRERGVITSAAFCS